jgi:hypothetical protein
VPSTLLWRGPTAYAVAGVGGFDGGGKGEVLRHNATGDTGYWITNGAGEVTAYHDTPFP